MWSVGWAFKRQVCILRHLLPLPIWRQMITGAAEIGWKNPPRPSPPALLRTGHLQGANTCFLPAVRTINKLLSSTKGVGSLFVPTLGISLKIHHEEERCLSEGTTVSMCPQERGGGSCWGRLGGRLRTAMGLFGQLEL